MGMKNLFVFSSLNRNFALSLQSKVNGIAPSRYRKAKDDICYWITDEWYRFESPMQKEIVSVNKE